MTVDDADAICMWVANGRLLVHEYACTVLDWTMKGIFNYMWLSTNDG